jgi:hypothetical protein
MRIVLHIGMPKAGSSALQAGLAAARNRLSDAGILYPDGGRGWNSHPLLLPGTIPAARLPRRLLQVYDDDEQAIGRVAEAWLSSVATTVAAMRPHTLLLSEESLFKVTEEDGLALLAKRLRRLGDVVHVVAYVRRPSDYYLSAVQQTLKASHRFNRPGRVAYRPTLEGFAKHVADEMSVMKYDPPAWPNGDIYCHFAANVIPEGHALAVDSPRQVNTSLSAEAMSILAEYRRHAWLDDDNRFTPDTSRIVDALIQRDAHVGDSWRPVLKDEIRFGIDHGSVDIVWLRDEYGIIFDGIDYERVHPATPMTSAKPRVEDICLVDDERRSELMFQVLHHLAQGQATVAGQAKMTPDRLRATIAATSERARGRHHQLVARLARMLRARPTRSWPGRRA